ncbi:trehalose/maltose hydrolase-like predicted phosphorylase [Kineococcus xinjiangensis]|uniref:Trehalose/maltose hydrolase-like predicted phosphorylase n=1 Tax=Kineococcus xinjiangensis TaxID=512762 RepID=A0A2S6IK78_9ACTN|nr:glycosyl hydrolase family 65 protein [Kineococcus xinjiangensis]PPK94581.1 trehalose/maltose hydrolase-like predicted phosphorylase [Kineococcus xinjiangensis]
MIGRSTFGIDPWQVREPRLDLDVLAQSESVFALSNGHLGFRGNLEEGEPHGVPGTYLNSFFEERPLPHAEAGYGYPEIGQSIVNVTNGKLVRLMVDDEPFDVRYGQLVAHERVLDLRAGTLTRHVEWISPAGRRVRVHTVRLVSFTQRAVAALEYVVEAVDAPVRLIIQSLLVANEAVPTGSGDPRAAAALRSPLVPVEQDAADLRAVLVHRTRASGRQMAAGMDHRFESPGRVQAETRAAEDWARTSFVTVLQPGQRVRLEKTLAYGWSSRRSQQALRDQVASALTGARYSGLDGLLAEQRAYLDEFWDAADVQVEGDPVVQQAVRFGLFHVLQAGARSEGRCIPAKGLTGPGYDGHTFWDTEAYVLPVLTYTAPEATADALRWRHATLGQARHRARELGLRGAAFPWRTIGGAECSGYWPASTAAFHLNADVALAVDRYRTVTGDDSLEREGGLELLVETARLWMSLGHHDRDGRWHVVGVTGPDEYTAVVADNVFTNLAAAANLRAAAAAVRRNPDLARMLGVDMEEGASWRDAANAVHVPYDPELGVHPQHEGFTRLPEWDFAAHADYPLLLSAPYFDLYRRQVVKQADLALAMVWFGDRFAWEDKARNVDYYERRTVRDSSLSASVQAVVAAEVGHLDLAHDYTWEAALVDLRDLHRNTRDGLHIASLAGTWIALVNGFGGLRDHGGTLSFDPRLPQDIDRLRFTLRWHGRRLSVDVEPDRATYLLRDGSDGSDGAGVAGLRLRHAGEDVTVEAGVPLTLPVLPRAPLLPRPPQPPGRAPAARPTPSGPALL